MSARPFLVIAVLAAACGSSYGAEGPSGSNDPVNPTEPRPLADGGDAKPDGGGASEELVDDGRRGWHAVGAPIPTVGSMPPALATLGNGATAVAYWNDDGVEVQGLVAGAWRPIGARFPVPGLSPLALAATPTSLFLAWHYAAKNHLREWNGTTWTTPAGSPLGSASTFYPHVSLTIGPDTKPWVAFNEHLPPATQERSIVKSQDSAGFLDRGAPIAIGMQSALAPSVAAGAGKVYLVHEGSGVHAYEWSGSSWVELGNGIVPPPAAGPFSSPSTPSIAVDGAGRAVVAYHAYLNVDSGTLGFVARWSGAAWVHVGSPFQALPAKVNNQASFTSVRSVAAAADGTVYVVFSEVNASNEEGVHVLRCGDTSCAPLGRGRLDPVAGVGATNAKVMVDRLGRPVVAWTEGDRVHVWRYHGDPDN